ncbi:wurstfest [Haematobia irritans]|uniref:wurstfest n=1 Tax=Haematobia irritans TaxID=7368 RepID=UPI003F4F97E7
MDKNVENNFFDGNEGDLKSEDTQNKSEETPMASASSNSATITCTGFSPEEFLARASMNEKINNILRNPIKSPTRTHQRSVFTVPGPAAAQSSRFNPSIEPFVPQHQRLVDTNASASTSLGRLSARSSSLPFPVSLPIQTSYRPYASAPSASMVCGGYNNLIASDTGFPSILYGASDNDMYRMFPEPMPPPPFALKRNRSSEYDLISTQSSLCGIGTGPIAMANGTIHLRLRDGIRIDMTLDKSIRVFNERSMVAIALSRNCGTSAVIHPNGRVLQNGSKVEIMAYDGMKTNNYVRYAKIWYKGISFTAENCALIYLVDTAGTRTTTDTFTDLTKDYTLTVFYENARLGPIHRQEALDIIQNSTYSCNEDGTETYEINGFRISQTADGLAKVTRSNNKCLIRTSPGNGSTTLTTVGIHCTASMGNTSHLFVRRNEKRMHFDGSCFIVRNAGHSAGFNESNLLIVY